MTESQGLGQAEADPPVPGRRQQHGPRPGLGRERIPLVSERAGFRLHAAAEPPAKLQPAARPAASGGGGAGGGQGGGGRGGGGWGAATRPRRGRPPAPRAPHGHHPHGLVLRGRVLQPAGQHLLPLRAAVAHRAHRELRAGRRERGGLGAGVPGRAPAAVPVRPVRAGALHQPAARGPPDARHVPPRLQPLAVRGAGVHALRQEGLREVPLQEPPLRAAQRDAGGRGLPPQGAHGAQGRAHPPAGVPAAAGRGPAPGPARHPAGARPPRRAGLAHGGLRGQVRAVEEVAGRGAGPAARGGGAAAAGPLREPPRVGGAGPAAARLAARPLPAGALRGRGAPAAAEGARHVPLRRHPADAAGGGLDPEEHAGAPRRQRHLLHAEELVGAVREVALRHALQAGAGGAGRLRARHAPLRLQAGAGRRRAHQPLRQPAGGARLLLGHVGGGLGPPRSALLVKVPPCFLRPGQPGAGGAHALPEATGSRAGSSPQPASFPSRCGLGCC
ncbi:carbohydrate sulfotransferase 3 isoform X1 [Pipistrellus kuhlii]|uniref:carbohydrate sulfotransferase 3 isoform X1 n=1 Tax=Pipistrellus kuhlii TaxID=59472 RepID=UPI001E2735FA|nr:carbohydrate sulfotransferase 3 isoform X1 [Pipistrellus kuhlii]